MAAPFASVDDLAARWRPLCGDELGRAMAALEDASAVIRMVVPDVDDRIIADTLDADVPRMVACWVAKRALIGNDTGGVSQLQQTVGPFSQGATYTNPLGDIYLTRQEKKLLGASGQKAFTIDTTPPAET